MKKSNLLYWIITGLFAAFMIFSAIPNIMSTPESIALIGGLGYPKYIIPYIGVAKLLGAIAILLPNLRRLKEWAYAGLFFDLSGAIYSGIASSGKFDPMMLSMAIWIVPGIVSYYFWRKKINQQPLSAP